MQTVALLRSRKLLSGMFNTMRGMFAAIALTVAIPSMVGQSAIALGAGDGSTLVEFALKANEVSRNRIHSGKVEFTIELTRSKQPGDDPETLAKMSGTAHVAFSGENVYTERDISSVNVSGATGGTTSKTVTNSRYFAEIPSRDNLILYEYDHHSIREMTPSAVRHRNALSPPDLFLFAFGTGDATFSAARAMFPNENRWAATYIHGGEDDGKILMSEFTRAVTNPSIPTLTFMLDPSCGFLVTRFRGYGANGQVGIETNIKVSAIGKDKIWFPIEIVQNRYAAWYSKPDLDATEIGANKCVSQMSIKVDHVDLDEAIQSTQFELDALRPRVGCQLFRTDTEGKLSTSIRVNGTFVPENVKVRLVPTQIVEPPSSKSQSNLASPTIQRSHYTRISLVWLSGVVTGVAILAGYALVVFRRKERTK